MESPCSKSRLFGSDISEVKVKESGFSSFSQIKSSMG